MSRYVPPHLRGGASSSSNAPPDPPSDGGRGGNGSRRGVGFGGAGGSGRDGFHQQGSSSSLNQNSEREGSQAFGGNSNGGERRERWSGGGGRDEGFGGRRGFPHRSEVSSEHAGGSASSWKSIRENARSNGGAGNPSLSNSSLARLASGGRSERGFERYQRGREDVRQAVAPKLTPEEEEKERLEREAAEKERHPDMFSRETVNLQNFYTEHSEVFRQWADCRSRGFSNKHIAHFFDRKKEGKQSQNKRAGAHSGAEIRPIFTQFFKYAIDIDNGLAYTERAKDIAIAQGSCWFLDFGFAPGGMADLLLQTHPDIKGVGVSLEPNKGGNVYVEELDQNERFWILLGDVILHARDDLDLKKACNLPDDFEGFDFVIIGITIHQEWEGDNMNELKDLLHFAQLYFAIKYCKPGAMIMMRMHMSVRLVDCHFLALMLSLFDLEKFSGLKVGQQRIAEAAAAKASGETDRIKAEKAAQAKMEAEAAAAKAEAEAAQGRSKLDAMFARQKSQRTSEPAARDVAQHYAWTHLDKTAVATKPFSTFSMRKTYWVMYHGFDCSPETRTALLGRLSVVLGENVFAYGWNNEEARFNRPILLDEDIDDVLSKYGHKMISVLEDVWIKQVEALEGFMQGLTDKFCRDGGTCRRRHCNMAHGPSDMIPAVLDALYAVDVRANPRLAELTAQGWL